jgi:alcohol dehydrogenase
MDMPFYDLERVGTFLSPNKVMIGSGTAQQVGREVKGLGGIKALVVTDKGVMGAGLTKTIEDSLRAENVEYGIYDQVEPEPPARIVDDCGKTAREGGYDVIVGFGGGSSLDVAKSVALLGTNTGKILDYAGIDMVPKKGLPKILIPTTAGTGSEVTRALVITDETDNTKKAVYSNFVLADVAILDPLVTLSMPPSVTADTGLDALVHAIESYVSINATPFSEILALEAIRIIARSLPTAYGKGSNVQARYAMLLAASLAGMAFTSGGLGAVHGLANPLGPECNIGHGRANAIMLPHVMKASLIGNLQKFAAIGEAMGEDISPLDRYEAAEKSVQAVEKLLRAVNISCHLSEYGVDKAVLPALVEGGMKIPRLLAVSPKDLTLKNVEEIYRNAF